MKVARWVWSRGKDGDNIKILPIAIKVTGAMVKDDDRWGGHFLLN
ncbi:hypothetical protein ACN6MT_05955 [Neobacillus niacini]